MITRSSKSMVKALRETLGEDVVGYERDPRKGTDRLTLKGGSTVTVYYSSIYRAGRALYLPKSHIMWKSLQEQKLDAKTNAPLSEGEKYCLTAYVNPDGRIFPHPDNASTGILQWGHIHRGGLKEALHFANHDPVTAALCDPLEGMLTLHKFAAAIDPTLANIFHRTGDEVEFVNTLLGSPRLHLAVTERLLARRH